MGLFDTIKNIYKKVDNKVGGYLPGGNTPAQVRAPVSNDTGYRIPTAPQPQPQPTFQPGPTVEAAKRLEQATGGATPTREQITESLRDPRTSSSSTDKTKVFGNAMNQAPVNQEQAPSEFTGGTGRIDADPNPQGFFEKAIGQFTSGFSNVKDPAGRDTFTRPELEQAGVLTRLVGEIALAGTGGEAIAAKLVSYYKNLKTARTATTVITQADKLGATMDNIGGAVKVGTEFGGKTVKNTKQATQINTIILDSAKKVSPVNWKTLIGLGSGAFGLATGVAGISIWSGFGVRNSYSDTQQQLGIMITNAYKRGDVETGDKLQELADDNTAMYNEIGSKIWSNPVKAGESIGEFVDTVKEANNIEREKAIEKADEEQLLMEITQRVKDGTATEEERAFYLSEYPNSPEAYDMAEQEQDTQENTIDTDRLAYGEELANRILAERPTAEQLINDPEVKAFALDPNNQFSAITKLYNEAIAATGREGFSGDSGSYGTIEPGSTLNFGLLNTGSQMTEAKETEEEPVVEAKQTLNDKALDMFGIPYSRLTEEQKRLL